MPAESIFSQMWNAYRSIILRSIVTSFGLDFIVRDQTGGDVDTIHNVRETGQFKSAQNEVNYQNRGEYNGIAYHHNDTYDSTIRMAKESRRTVRTTLIAMIFSAVTPNAASCPLAVMFAIIAMM